MRRFAVVRTIACSLVLAVPAAAQVDSADQRHLFTWRDGALAAVFAVATVSIRPLDKTTADRFQTPAWQKNQVLKKSALGLRTIADPGAVLIGISMYTAGRVWNNDKLAELGAHGTEALFVGGGVALILKNVFGRARPFVDSVPNPDNWQLLRGFTTADQYRSFPSGHTVAAFSVAAAVSAETSRWYPRAIYLIGPTMYGGAALVGLSRMYDNRHWASDVIMGAAIGTFSGTKVVRYHRTHPGNRFDKWLLNASVTPGDWSHASFSLVPRIR